MEPEEVLGEELEDPWELNSTWYLPELGRFLQLMEERIEEEGTKVYLTTKSFAGQSLEEALCDWAARYVVVRRMEGEEEE